MRKFWQRIKHIWSEIHWFIIAVLWLIAGVLGYAGFSRYSLDNGLGFTVTERIYRSFQLISMNSGAVDGKINWMLDCARFLMPTLTAYTAIQALFHFFREQTQTMRLWFLRGHVIVCGIGRKGSHLLDDLLKNGRKIVAIDRNLDPLVVDDYRRKGVVVLEGDAKDPDTLQHARIQHARHLICLLGEDRQNLKIAHQAFYLSPDRRKDKLTCIVHLVSQDLLNILKRSELALGDQIPVELETFNIYDQAARRLLEEDPGWAKLSHSDEISAHILVIGLGRLGQNVILQAAYRWYRLGMKKRLKVTMIDLVAESKCDDLLRSYPYLAKVCELIPIQKDISNNAMLAEAISHADLRSAFQRIYICLGDSVLSLQVSLALEHHADFREIPTLVRLSQRTGFADLLLDSFSHGEHPAKFIPFDIYNKTCCNRLVVGGVHERLAMKLHQNYLKGIHPATATAQLGLDWNGVPEVEKNSSRAQANRIYQLLTANGYQIDPLQDWDAADRRFSADEVEAMARMEHQLWCQWKREQGWKKGKVRDVHQKTNPDLIPWEELPTEEQEKNRTFIRHLPILLAEIGFQIDPKISSGYK